MPTFGPAQIVAILAALTTVASAQPAARASDPRLMLRTLVARRVIGRPPVIDGRLDDAAWRDAPAATDFVASRPVPGGVPSLPTEARVVYDDEALYVAVRAYDPHPEAILAPYPRRDDEITSDWIFVEIDSRHDRRSGFSFGLNPRGVQVDGTWANDGDYDAAWNGVWTGAARIDSLGWTAEFRIPFSQLALPTRRDAATVAAATFGLNVYRASPRRGEVSNWSPRLPTLAGVVSHFNELRGLTLPQAVPRLEVVPYTAARAARAPAATGDVESATLPRGGALLAGADARLRLTPALTLAATVHPDFGQVEADPSVVNLTAFETYFPEQRPFFVDGADRFAFNAVASAFPGDSPAAGFGLAFGARDVWFGDDAPFYSRRVGRPPHADVLTTDVLGGRRVLDAPAATDLHGALKLTGRTDAGWSLGALAALTSPATATLSAAPADPFGTHAMVEPRTGFAVARLAREAADGRSAVGGLVTATRRFGLDPAADDGDVGRASLATVLPTDAVVAALDARHRFALGATEPQYEASGFVAASRMAGTPAAIRTVEGDDIHALLRPDASATYRDDSTRRTLDGTAAQLRVAKLAGHWLGSVTGHLLSPGFTANDLGFQQNADWLLAAATFAYQRYEPGAIFRRWSLGVNRAGIGWSFAGERRAAVLGMKAAGELRNEWGGNLQLGREFTALATDVLRGGPALLVPPRTTWGASVHSDTRRATQLTLAVDGFREPATGGRALSLEPALDARVSDRLRVAMAPTVAWRVDAWHDVGATSDADAAPVGTAPAGAPLFVVGRLRETTASLTTRADLAFSAHATLQLYAQPLVGSAAYDRFAAVTAPRATAVADRTRPLAGALPTGVTDPSFGTRRALATLVWRWEYRPGSTFFAVFTQRRTGDPVDARWNPGASVRAFGGDPTANVLLLKASYWWQP